MQNQIQNLDVPVTSTSAMIMHNGQLADPLNEWVLLMKPIIAKRSKKNEDDLIKLMEYEFKGSLYLEKNGDGSEHIVIPQHIVDATIVNGAKKVRQGPLAKVAVWANKHSILKYDGPASADELWKDNNFRDVRGVVVGRARVMRCRPIFKNWKAVLHLSYDDSQTNESQILEWVELAGLYVGFCEMRPKYGRFEFVS